MYGHEQTTREKIIEEYRADVDRLLRFLPWLMKKNPNETGGYYEGDGEHKVIKIPVYDSTLLQFVKEAEQTKLVNKYYPYAYTRYKVTNVEDEKRAIDEATITDIDILKGILSKYVLQGKTKSTLWKEGISEGIFTALLLKLQRLFYTNSRT